MTSGFDSQILADKLNKLNSSQQSIQSLSSWCISHRRKARQVVEIWEKLFISSSKERKVSFLYLANDILQNSRRKGSEFVNEFWKALPGALKNVYENADDHGKNVVLRLVGIWEERKVFGSRGQGLKNNILGKELETPIPLENNGKILNANPMKVVKKDAQTIRLKLEVGGMPEKLITAYQSVLDEHFSEDTALNKCKAAIHRIEDLAKDVDDAISHGNLQGSSLINELQEQEAILKQCIEQLRCVEETRESLIAHLKEGLQEQESKLVDICSQIQAAQSEMEHASNLRQRAVSTVTTTALGPNHDTNHNFTMLTAITAEEKPMAEPNSALQTPNGVQLNPSPQPITSITAALPSTDEQDKKAAVAAMAAKLAASTSSAQMLTSVLSSLVAEEAASKNGTLTSSTTSSSPTFPVEKRPRLENPMQVSDLSSSYFSYMQTQMGSVPLSMPPVSMPVSAMPPLPPNNHQLPPLPPLPPPPPQSLLPPPGPQFTQTNGGMVGVMPYGFPTNPPPPSLPLPLPSSVGLARPSTLLTPPPPPPLPPVPPPQQQLSPVHQHPGNGLLGQLQSAPAAPQQ